MKQPHLTWFSVYWLAWLIAFIVPELYWVFTNSANTLSAEVWSIEGLNMNQPFDFPVWTATHWAVAVTVWLLFLWLSIHLPFGLMRLWVRGHQKASRASDFVACAEIPLGRLTRPDFAVVLPSATGRVSAFVPD